MRIFYFILCLTTATAGRVRHRKLKLAERNGIGGQYIIRYDSHKVRNAKTKTLALTENWNGTKRLFIFNSVFKGASIRGVSDSALEQILADTDVLFVEQVCSMYRSLPPIAFCTRLL